VVLRTRAGKIVAALVASCSISGFCVVVGESPAHAVVSQSGGNDVGPWVNGWSWTYNQVFTYNDGSTADVTLDETVTYTVDSITTRDGYSTYQVGMSGSITGGSGSADGYSLKSIGGSVSGTAWFETGSRALVEEDQTQNVSGDVSESIFSVGFTASVNLNLTPTPPLAFEDFRLHNGDTWSLNSNIAETGNFSYDASGITSGGSPINSSQPIHGTESVTSTTINEPIASNIAVDRDAINDTSDQISNTSDWAPQYDNVAYESLSVPVSGSAATLTMSLASAHLPAPASTVSESVSPNLTCAGDPVSVSGTLSTGKSGVAVVVGLDEQPNTAGQIVTKTVTSGSGGAYSTMFTAPSLSDGLNKPGIRGSFGVTVTPAASSGVAASETTLEVTTLDCTSTVYSGDAAGPQGGSANVSATVTDVVTGKPLAGVPVTFSLSGQAATATATTGSNGVAVTTLALSGPARSATLTVGYAGNASEADSSTSSPFAVTTDPTVTTLTPSEPQATVGDSVTFSAQVATSGASVSSAPTGTVSFTVDGTQLGTGPVTLSAAGVAESAADSTMGIGTHQIVATYSGDVNDASSSQTIEFVVHKPLAPTSTALASSPNPSVYGQAVSLTATVSGGTPTGTVQFSDGAEPIASAPLDGTGHAWVMVSSLGAGSHTLTATYEGDDTNYNASTSPAITQTVDQDTSATTVTSSANPSLTGEGVTFDVAVAAVTPGAGTPTGTVQVAVNGVDLGTPVSLVGGAASVSDPTPPTGNDSVVATYSGDTNFTGGTGTIAQTVDPDGTSSVVESTPNPSLTGQAVTLTATVTPAAPGAGDPTGTVTFLDGSSDIGAASLAPTADGDQASIALATLAQGEHEITASFGGDSGFTASTSAPLDQTVDAAPPVVDTTTTVSSSQSPSVYGQGTTFIATVAAGGSSTPTGTVQFSVDGTDIGSPVTVVGGVAISQGISTLVAGAHTIIAAFSGDVGFGDSGQVFTQTVDQASTTVAGQASADPAPYGQAVTFSATVSAVAPGTGLPGGIVQFSLDGSQFGAPVPVTDGTATSGQAGVLTPGTHTVSFLASGDSNFVGSSGSFTFTVDAIPTTTTLTAAPNPVTYGQPVTLTATVAPAGPGTPAGTVTFYDGTAKLATVSVTPGIGHATATYTTSALAAGMHSITAVYSGDADYASSTSAATTVTVTAAPTTLAVAPAVLYLRVTPLPISIQLSLGVLSATLTSNGQPVAGQTITFEANAGSHPVLCAGTTNGNGVASCSSGLTGLTETLLSGGIEAVYAGSASYQASSGTAGLLRVQL
jgi:hypothetical protein